MKRKFTKIEIPLTHPREAQPAIIISDAAVATKGVGGGRLIPLLIINSTERPDIEELVRIHEYLPSGDVVVQWGYLKGAPERAVLFLKFTRPAEVFLVLSFDILGQGVIVEQILSSKALYLQPGRDGDRFSTTLDAKKILIEVPDAGFSTTWDELIFKYLVKDFRRKGLPKNQAKEATKRVIEEWRNFGQTRLWDSRP